MNMITEFTIIRFRIILEARLSMAPMALRPRNDSTNGTRINNVPITEQVLKNSDLILFGGVEVLFDSNEEGGESGSFTKTHTIDLSSIDSNVSTVQTMINLSPFAAVERKKHAMVQKVIIGVVALTALAVVGLVIWVLINMLNIGK